MMGKTNKQYGANKMNGKGNRSAIIISIVSIIISVTLSLITFILPLVRGSLVIENPSIIQTISDSEAEYDKFVLPLVVLNYGNSIRSINDMEATIEYDGNTIPVKPTYIYDSVNQNIEKTNKSFYSSFIVGPNEGCVKLIGFEFDPVNYTPRYPDEFHFSPNKLYTIHIRFYTTRNSFFGKNREIIQAIYGFETGDKLVQKAFSPTKQTWFEITDRHTEKPKEE